MSCRSLLVLFNINFRILIRIHDYSMQTILICQYYDLYILREMPRRRHSLAVYKDNAYIEE